MFDEDRHTYVAHDAHRTRHRTLLGMPRHRIFAAHSPVSLSGNRQSWYKPHADAGRCVRGFRW